MIKKEYIRTILVILSYIIRETVSVWIFIVGIIIIIGLLSLFVLNERNYKRTEKNLKLLSKIGASNIQLSIMNGFTILFFTENLLIALIIPFSCFFILVATRYFSDTILNIVRFLEKNPHLYYHSILNISSILTLGPIHYNLKKLRTKLNNNAWSLVSTVLFSIIISIILITNPSLISFKVFLMILAIITFYSIFPLYFFFQNKKMLKFFIQISAQ